ncbi:potassium-transporting ATPase subunit KdpA [Rhodococcus rhodnii]|uniref:Potassium-transporting ATPase potassium-binding subunit n=2 Tax=Rhodococcus rhodnii TaxID=38312 RepID=R7WPA3_9NOCA|nr:potassium-transporting ATPase subunit KdpA [Rhodococcus rhodnii]EOM77151.1 potassium-transporting ATPase subunit A [Rhodococcus rhodnii LMG 5362]TXG92138.1 potassium-transporting ATPase subunit KdpA [Rhodococcus rhodnii]
MPPSVLAIAQIAFVVAVLAAAYVPLGDAMARLFTREHPRRGEGAFYRMCRIDAHGDQGWVTYAGALLAFSFVSVLSLYGLQRLQGVLPLGGDLGAVSPAVAFNTAISFVTNTNWQSYVPETTMSNLVQPVGLAVQNFLSAAVGISVAIALTRAIARVTTGSGIGNFWVDLTRATVYVLFPLAFLFAALLLTQGVVQSLSSGFAATGIDGAAQHVALAPAASQEAIKMLGTNGGGVFAANSAHPFENPTPLSNIAQIVAMLLIPVALTRTFGTMIGNRRQGLTLLAVMTILWAAMLALATWAESRTAGAAAQAAGAMSEGKEVRFGIPASVLYAVSTTGTSTGAVNSAHDSYSAAGGGVLLLNMLFGEIAPGGVGSGLYTLLVLAIVAVFVGGLLVGRTPEFLGRRIGRREVTLAASVILVMPALVLAGAAITAILPATLGALGNSGDPGSPSAAHGFSEILYAYTSAANNNGSAFGGLTVTSDWFQGSLGVAMLLGRFLPIVLVLALAGAFARQRRSEPSPGAIVTTGPLFTGLVTGTVALVSALTFFPALALGPLAEALQ